MGNALQFQVKFITPLLSHGADSQKEDEVGLTGKALRGCWRFWCRAVIGGMRPDITPGELYELESQIFGSADESIGSKFRMRVEPEGDISSKKTTVRMQFSQREVHFRGFEEGVRFNVRILPHRKNMTDKQIDVLRASIWLWGNLGAVGQRARRGFGSPVIAPGKETFASANELEEYLKKVLAQAWHIFSDWLSGGDGSLIAQNSPPSRSDKYFTLRSLGQVAVCPMSKGADVKEALQKVHGVNRCQELGHIKNGKLASPVFLRMHKVKDEFYPVITWATPISPDQPSCARDWLRKTLGFSNYLSGDPI